MAKDFFVEASTDPEVTPRRSVEREEMMGLFEQAESNGVEWDYVGGDESVHYDTEVADDFNDLPEPLRNLLALIMQNQWAINAARAFYEEAVSMAHYTDSAPIVPFRAYYPVYAQMNVDQLRAYFTLRTLLRQGKHPEAAPSYLFVYVFETLMQVGVENAEAGYEILCDLRAAYPEINPMRNPYLSRWIKDYVVWYELKAHFADEFADAVAKNRVAEGLADDRRLDDDRLFDLLVPHSNYRMERSVFYKKNPLYARRAIAFVLRRYIEQTRLACAEKKGEQQENSYRMFAGAVFYQPSFKKDVSVDVSPTLKFVCHRGLWTQVRTTSPVEAFFSPQALGVVLRRADALLRRATNFKPALAIMPSGGYPLNDAWLQKAVADWAELEAQARRERKERERREELARARQNVRIDFSRLGSIRNDAQAVQAALLEGAEPETMESPLATPQPIERPPAAAPAPAAESEEAQEKALLRLLLDAKDYGDYLRQLKIPQGVMMERINDRMMDELGDVAIEENENGRLVVVEDYRDSLEAFCNS